MDEELERRYAEVERAEREWRDHRLSGGYEIWYGDDPSIGAATEEPFGPAWRKREAQLWAAFEAAHQAWLSHLPRP